MNVKANKILPSPLLPFFLPSTTTIVTMAQYLQTFVCIIGLMTLQGCILFLRAP